MAEQEYADFVLLQLPFQSSGADGSDSPEQRTGSRLQESAVPDFDHLTGFLEDGIRVSKKVSHAGEGLDVEAASFGAAAADAACSADTPVVLLQRLAELNEDSPLNSPRMLDLAGWLDQQLRDYHYHVPRVAAGGITTSERHWQLSRHEFLHWQLDERASMGPQVAAQALAGTMALNWILWSDTASPDLPVLDEAVVSMLACGGGPVTCNLTEVSVDGSDSTSQRTESDQIQESKVVSFSDYQSTYLGEGLWMSDRVRHNGDVGPDHLAAAASGNDCVGKAMESTFLQQEEPQTVQEHDDPLRPPRLADLDHCFLTPTAKLTRDLVEYLVGQLQSLHDSQLGPLPANSSRTANSDRRWQLGRHVFLHRHLEQCRSNLASAGEDHQENILPVTGAMALNWILWVELVFGILPQFDG